MIPLEKAVIARLNKNGIEFEILVDPDMALEFKKGKNIALENILAVPEIFKDAKKGERVSENDLLKCFHTKNIWDVVSEIIKKGEIQLTTEQKRRFIEEKKKEIADIISKQTINPQTKLPHPPSRILHAMEESHVNIDPFRPAKDQIEMVVSKIQSILPVSMERLEIAVRIPIEYAGKASSIIRNTVKIKNEEWKTDAWICLIDIPAGMQSEIYQRLNELTKGKVEVKILKEKPV